MKPYHILTLVLLALVCYPVIAEPGGDASAGSTVPGADVSEHTALAGQPATGTMSPGARPLIRISFPVFNRAGGYPGAGLPGQVLPPTNRETYCDRVCAAHHYTIKCYPLFVNEFGREFLSQTFDIPCTPPAPAAYSRHCWGGDPGGVFSDLNVCYRNMRPSIYYFDIIYNECPGTRCD